MANKRKPVTMEEMNRNWDDWWNSLTDSQKQKLVEEIRSILKNYSYFGELFLGGAAMITVDTINFISQDS